MIVDSILTVQKDELTRKEWAKLFAKLTFYDKDENEVTAFEYVPGADVVRMPRGVWSLLPDKIRYRDLRSRPRGHKFRYAKNLGGPGYEGQRDAVMAMFAQQQGQVIAPPGKGKTEIALAFAASCRTPTLVVVHTKELFKQWQDRAAESVPEMSVGKIQGKTCQVGDITIAMAQTLKRYVRAGGKFWRKFGCIIVDEAHHAAAETWEWLLNVCPAYFRFGVTASEKRSDRREKLVNFNIGPVIYKFKFESQVPMTVHYVESKFTTKWNGTQWTRIMRELTEDEERNAKIARIARREIDAGRTVLVLSRQIKHLEYIYASMGQPSDAKIVTGRLPRKVRESHNAKFREGSLRCVLGTQIYEEGVDFPRLDCIILAFPGTEIPLLQKVGRGGRQAEGKTDTVIYDIVDDLVPVLARQFLERRTWYKANKVKIGKVVKHAKDKRTTAKEKGRLSRVFQVRRP